MERVRQLDVSSDGAEDRNLSPGPVSPSTNLGAACPAQKPWRALLRLVMEGVGALDEEAQGQPDGFECSIHAARKWEDP